MFTANMHEFKIQQAELVREAKQYRLLRSLRDAKSPSRDLNSLIQGFITTILFL